jgi:hypothetical protein
MSSAARRWRLAWWAGLLSVIALAATAAITFGGSTPTRPRAAPAVGLPVELHPDARDALGPLDMTEAVVVQRDVRMLVRLTTAGTWKAADLIAAPGRAVCFTFVFGHPAIPRSRVCVTRQLGHPALTYAPLAADGTAGTPQRIGAAVRRPNSHVLEASFLPVAAGLSVGPYSWYVQTSWTSTGECATTCSDRLPDAGAIASKLDLLGVVPCFGAAARDPLHPCQNPALRLAVQPPATNPGAILDPYCDTKQTVPISICGFGAAPADAAGTFAVIGDSHAAGLKTALEVLTLAKRWHGVSMLLSACPATKAMPILPTRARTINCARWNRAVLTRLETHRDVDTVFLSTHRTSEFKTPPGQRMVDVAKAGYRDEILALLSVVERVVVVRDTPFDQLGHLHCIEVAVKAGRAPGPACARPRHAAVKADPLTDAARELHAQGVQIVDLTSQDCDATRCFPVVGGALVHRDETHITPAYSASLGPFILRALGG